MIVANKEKHDIVSRPVYEPPKIMKLDGPGDSLGADCSTSGSSAGDCITNGSNADPNCSSSGSTAGECRTGDTAINVCGIGNGG
jgi:hypothetical protein